VKRLAAALAVLFVALGTATASAQPLAMTQADLGKLAPGRYTAGLFLDDGYSVLARTSFRVVR
jgi:hypothetical protein